MTVLVAEPVLGVQSTAESALLGLGGIAQKPYFLFLMGRWRVIGTSADGVGAVTKITFRELEGVGG